ncbi:helix-turn-helix domain-containing protein [Paenibacillus antri]|nr:helix-turn-helix domain-containing protein [Paenibacillus antri]
MRKSWFYKLLFSYLPVFFIVISFLIAVFFFSVGEITREAAVTVNRGAAAHTLEVVDHSLRSIEQMMIKELMTTDGIQNFYNETLWDEPFHRMVRPSDKLRDIVTQFPMIHSMYMVRWEDETVLSVDAALPLSRFEDRAFVESYLETGDGSRWTSLRPYKELTNQNATDVVTLVKPYPVPAGDQGVLVVNVRGQSVRQLVQEMFDSGFLQALLVDRAGDTLFATGLEPLPTGRTFTEAQSDYTGWIMKSQIRGGAFYRFASSFNNVLLSSGLAAIIAAVFYITYISKRNYRPLASLTERVHGYAQLKAEQLLRNGGKDEFAFIETALDQMIEQSDELLGQREEHLQSSKRQWVKDTLEGDYDTVSERAWPDKAERYGWNAPRVRAAVLVVEIDRYMEFCERYTKRDQSLLKFLLGNVAHEIALQHGAHIFGEWLTANKWSAFLQLKEGQTTEDVAMLAQGIVTWIQSNVDFQVTIGLGDVVARAEDISASYEQALHALQYKMTLGNCRVIGHWEAPDPSDAASRGGMADFRGLTQSFKLGEPEWETHYERFVEELRTGASPKEELLHQVNYLVYQLSRELSELNADYQRIWSEEAAPRIHRLLKHFDTFEELRTGLGGILTDAQRRMAALREERTYSSTMKEVRRYIADNFSNPDLSLNHLSDAFDLNPKYVSHLFKEEFGEKFVEYLAGVRMEQAKELLAATTLSIQEIALRVGYTHSFSFIRMFKKIVGLTPGDYRKQAAPPS